MCADTATTPRRTRARWATLIALAATVVVLATGCAPTGSASQTVTPTNAQLYPKLANYPDIEVVENVQYGTAADGQPLYLDVCLPNTNEADAAALKPRASVVSIHGGSWARGDKSNINWRSVCQWLADEGYVAVSVGYRLAPESVFPAGIDDVQAAVRWLREGAQVKKYNLNPDLVGAFGGSAGGNLAALLGTEGAGDLASGARVAAVAELSGPVDLTDDGRKLGGLSDDFEQVQLDYLGCASLAVCPTARAASPLYQVDDTDPPFFVGHSIDERIPVEQSEAFVEELREHSVETEFVTVEGSSHSIAMLDADMRDRIAEFFAIHL
ncbi:MAG TPA: alpha/beta hydrolase, partial [Glaciihabitans sp.]|nr:alpha/beta hydrolase [Glaciihabitans sp.]